MGPEVCDIRVRTSAEIWRVVAYLRHAPRRHAGCERDRKDRHEEQRRQHCRELVSREEPRDSIQEAIVQS